MPVKKRRNRQHMMEERSIAMLREALPVEWVMHEYKPDYGIDFVVEVFEFLKSDPTTAETLGETFFVQLKSIERTKIETERVFRRRNVEKYRIDYDKHTYLDIEVIKFDIDVPELLTVRSMGVGMPVLLVLACLDLGRLFYVCLNDLIDKVVDPEDAGFADQQTKRISIPVKNELKRDGIMLVMPRFYAKRAKLLAAFTKFEFQRSEMSYGEHEMAPEAQLTMALHFIAKLKSFDIWDGCDMWELVAEYRKMMEKMERMLADTTIPPEDRIFFSQQLWQGLVAMSHTFEELCREWHLPTYLAQYLSYPDLPKEPNAGPA
jgi:hypothetical protein